MGKIFKENQSNFILKSKIALTNVETQPEIAKEMAEMGYDAPKIAEGKQLVAAAEKSLADQRRESNEESAASQHFKDVYSRVDALYRSHRKKAQFVFMDNASALNELKVNVSPSAMYSKWREEVNGFYTAITSKEDYMKMLTSAKLKTEEVEEMKKLLPQMDDAYSNYFRESGESQEATRKKHQAFAPLDEYMRRFWRAADIALEDVPQLKEALMKGVK